MSEPNPDDPLMPEIADELRYQRDKVTRAETDGRTLTINMINICLQFNTTAAEWTRTHAAQEKENQQKVKRLKVN